MTLTRNSRKISNPKAPLIYTFDLNSDYFYFKKEKINTGQIVSLGVPRRSIISSIWFISLLPGSKGLCSNNSPNIHPADQISIAVVWYFDPLGFFLLIFNF